MDLSMTYLGMELPHPFMAGASPLVDDIDAVLRMQDAGAAAIVMHSLFEEQITQEQMLDFLETEVPSESYAEATSYFPTPTEYALGPERYLEQVAAIKQEVDIPLIASLNGVTAGGWLEYARLIEQAGADALELNIYFVPTDPQESGEEIERRVIEIGRRVREAITIPIAMKLSPFYTSFANLAHRLDQAGVDGLVLFNRFYQPDIDPDELEAKPSLRLSNSKELLLRLRWLAILFGRVECSLAVTGGVHTVEDAVKSVMAGANAVQMVSRLLKDGVDVIGEIRQGVAEWLEEREYDSLRQAHGSMSHQRVPDPSAFERGNYARILQSWRERNLARGDLLFS
jgi:dihydroorotate dehydrogenase (fumarate)